ncbi:MAG: hypothetical protein ABII07_05950 [Patescibacteria group bacterium]|nr:hypothetical protein [Patescibacteria group bacterium]
MASSPALKVTTKMSDESIRRSSETGKTVMTLAPVVLVAIAATAGCVFVALKKTNLTPDEADEISALLVEECGLRTSRAVVDGEYAPAEFSEKGDASITIADYDHPDHSLLGTITIHPKTLLNDNRWDGKVTINQTPMGPFEDVTVSVTGGTIEDIASRVCDIAGGTLMRLSEGQNDGDDN